ncbi:hypothetical protein [Acidimangrovimonas sediminis]|uniref:hypothetical protein n=1 Tax=Acidimangrovimonas sediminis TaxID=2056283 RepID=UPI000C7F9B90|nr:hypothetical protein [Acidimangrovimonas sediminis]
MSVSFTIFPRRGLVYVRYEGQVKLQETGAVFAEYARHPDWRPGQRQLVDLSGVTGFDPDYAELLKIQAQKADVFLRGATEVLLVYCAPTPATYAMAEMARRSWEGLDGVIVRAVHSEAEALHLLGQPEDSIAALMASAG